MSKTGIDYISIERERQVNEEGWFADHDARHINGELAAAASAYALPSDKREMVFEKESEPFGETETLAPKNWPWHSSSWKPTPDDRIRELTKAGALIAAEIDRLLALKQQ